MFQTNTAKAGLVFPKGHAYFNHVPENALLSFGEANFVKDQWHQGDGAVYESGLAHTKPTLINSEAQRKRAAADLNEYYERIKVSKLLANHYNDDIYILPILNPTDWRYPYFFRNVPTWGRSPDFYFGKEFWEMKGYEGKYNSKKISNIFYSIAKKRQAKNIIVRLTDDVNITGVEKQIRGQIKGRGLEQWIDKVVIVDVNNKIIPAKL
jgi:hypothetical protein